MLDVMVVMPAQWSLIGNKFRDCMMASTSGRVLCNSLYI